MQFLTLLLLLIGEALTARPHHSQGLFENAAEKNVEQIQFTGGGFKAKQVSKHEDFNWRRFDENHDGILSRDEFAKAQEGLWHAVGDEANRTNHSHPVSKHVQHEDDWD
eukprot:CAMPEP_0169072616 /NCGR_PEP_ID=MMETSP1015-20121227/6293_1 /TAXON_ID=342587 /ORGANISM="Karlodinium micrum, Strain CCMP2283" /LENGTH=108 /DNA_ID=CAMNT_0009131791 /DNA_START=80 /DNA_END=403 /DNA_ORIENTATION=+